MSKIQVQSEKSSVITNFSQEVCYFSLEGKAKNFSVADGRKKKKDVAEQLGIMRSMIEKKLKGSF